MARTESPSDSERYGDWQVVIPFLSEETANMVAEALGWGCWVEKQPEKPNG